MTRRTNGVSTVLGCLFLTVVAANPADARQRPVTGALVDRGDAWEPIREPAAADLRGAIAVSVQVDRLRQAARTGGLLTLPLTGGVSVQFRTTWVHADATQSMVAGPLLDAEGEASLTLVGDVLAGRIVMNGRLFVVRHLAGSDAHVVTEVAQGSLRPEAPPRPAPAGRRTPEAQPAMAADSNAFVDLMILYTPAARAEAGGALAMSAELMGAVNNANLALANSGAVHRFRLVHHGEVAYVETGDIKTTLNELTDSTDGFMDGVQPLRDQFKADVVTVLSADTNACGIGWLMGPDDVNASFESLAYNVTKWDCANANLSLAHEIGHNMGLHHDRPFAESDPAFPYAYGYTVNRVGRDVMAYDFSCSSGCLRKPIYSTPLHTFPNTNVVAGTPTEDNARALNNTSSVVANFRQSCSYALSAAAATATAGGGSATVSVITTTGCSWVATSNDPAFLTITHLPGGPGSGMLSYLVAPNTGAPRTGTLQIAGFTFSVSQAQRNGAADFDHDASSDIAVYRPSSGSWYILKSSANFGGGLEYAWGASTDIPVTGDFDGDAKNDIVVFRPSSGHWFVLKSSTGFTAWDTYQRGAGGIPIPGDYDGDGRTDLAFYLPSSGGWNVRTSITNYTSGFSSVWGGDADVPLPGDYDGDRKTDLAVYRPSSGHWFIARSTSASTTWITIQWGTTGDVPVPADYDGDRRTDIAVYRPSNGRWYILTSGSGFVAGRGYAWGASTDVPVPGDYDGDGKTDIAVYRPASGRWLILKSTTNYTAWVAYQWGTTGDKPVLARQ